MLLRTDRLLLRPFEPGDVDDVWAFMRLPEVALHMLREPRDRAGSAALVRTMMTETKIVASGDAMTFAVVLPESGTVIGEVSIILRSAPHRCAEIGYELHPGHHGRGLATEASEALLRLGFDELRLHRIIAKCSTRNSPSARLMERLGMRREGHLIGVGRVKGNWRDEYVYAILAEEWRVTRSR